MPLSRQVQTPADFGNGSNRGELEARGRIAYAACALLNVLWRGLRKALVTWQDILPTARIARAIAQVAHR